MSLFYKLYNNFSAIIIDNQVSLQNKMSNTYNQSYPEINGAEKRRNKKSCKVRTFVTTFNLCGSLTVEAALVLSLFLIIFLSLISLFQVIYTYHDVQNSLINAGKQACAAGDLIDGFSEVYVCMTQNMDTQKLERWGINGGLGGISISGSYVQTDKGLMVMNISYKIKPPLLMLPGINIKMRHHLEMYLWTGYHSGSSHTDGGGNRTVYYIAENESVYHCSAQCSHLRLSISVIDRSEVSQTKNSSGHGYSQCSKCSSYANGTSVYITEDGTKYHNSLNCSGLKRTVQEVYDTGALDACSRCGGTG